MPHVLFQASPSPAVTLLLLLRGGTPPQQLENLLQESSFRYFASDLPTHSFVRSYSMRRSRMNGCQSWRNRSLYVIHCQFCQICSWGCPLGFHCFEHRRVHL